MVQFHICCNLMCLDHPLWNRLDRNMAPFNYLESWHMVLEILIRFFIFYSFWGAQNTADIVSPNNRCAKERASICDHVIWKLSMKRNFYLFNNNREREREKMSLLWKYFPSLPWHPSHISSHQCRCQCAQIALPSNWFGAVNGSYGNHCCHFSFIRKAPSGTMETRCDTKNIDIKASIYCN